MIEENQKTSPFALSNKGETLDENFFVRLKRFEDSFKRKINNSELQSMHFEAVAKINGILSDELVSFADVKKAIGIYNKTPKGGFNEKAFWFDYCLHLRHIAYVYGRELEIDDDFSLIIE